MWKRRALEVTADLLAGDGLATMLAPVEHMRLWQSALPWAWWHELTRACIARPWATRALGLSQIVVGAWMMAKANDERSTMTDEGSAIDH